jgi:group I intron endonuclease
VECKITGIYKITNPNGKIYIGQSINVVKRKKDYEKLRCKKQPRLYNSLLKYGFINHNFELIEQCEIYLLNERERYWQDYYSASGKKGLNCQLTKTSAKRSEHSLETKIKIGLSSSKRKHTDETKLKISLSNKGKVVKKETRLKMSIATKSQCIEIKDKRAFSNLGKKRSLETKEKIGFKKRAIILNLETGIFYIGIEEASKSIEMKRTTLKAKLSGQNKNNTNFIYV